MSGGVTGRGRSHLAISELRSSDFLVVLRPSSHISTSLVRSLVCGIERAGTQVSCSYKGRGILIFKISETPIVHVPKLFPLLHRFQNYFCFCSKTFPSHGGSFFSTSMGISMGKRPKSKNGQKSLSEV